LTLLEAKRSGIVLLHDVQPHTAAAIPMLLRKLRTRGYSIVQAVATDAETKPVRSDPSHKRNSAEINLAFARRPAGISPLFVGYEFGCWTNDNDDAKPLFEQAIVANHSHKRRLSGGSSEASDRQLPSLTPLRGIAALWVVLYHCCGTAQFFPNLDITPHSYLISKGYLAVDIFFVLSGFVMAHVYRRAFFRRCRRALSRLSGGAHRAALSAARFHSFAICRDRDGIAVPDGASDRLVREHTAHWSAIVGRDYR
jgi:hypothetical protein